MNIRSLTRGDGVVIGAAVLLFIASFLDTYGNGGSNVPNAWDNLGLLMSMYIGGFAGAALIVVARALPQPRKVVGLDLGQLGVALSVFSAWTAFWTIIDPAGSVDTGGFDVESGAGLILGLIAALLLAAGAIATPLLPALQAALIPAPRPVAPQPYGAQPPGGYGYPGAGAPQPGQPYGGQPQPGQPYGGQPQPGQPQPGQPQAPQPAGDFSPFWFAVPVARPLFAEDGSQSPIAELAPGTWYLAVEQRGANLVAQTQDGRRGVLQDTSGIQRG
ncbi:hypothetical protein [Streptomyces sp. RG80]|uniref:hypothetical protein n=1 Tax=Streptomyces sp. RG80 TaxID=3157340 RepID=UPI00338D9347